MDEGITKAKVADMRRGLHMLIWTSVLSDSRLMKISGCFWKSFMCFKGDQVVVYATTLPHRDGKQTAVGKGLDVGRTARTSQNTWFSR